MAKKQVKKVPKKAPKKASKKAARKPAKTAVKKAPRRKVAKKAVGKRAKKSAKKVAAPPEPPVPAAEFPADVEGRPALGLVCLSSDERVKFRAMTRATFLKTPENERRAKLETLYWDNIARVHFALSYCHARQIRLYRITSALFPMSDESLGQDVLRNFSATLSSIGRRARRLGIRVVIHPDQFVVLSSENPSVVQTSITILAKHALWMDLMGLDQSPWNLMNIHAGKAGRGEQLVKVVETLPDNIRNRLTFENDEHGYSSAEVLDICRRTGCPFVFDCHHHLIHDNLASYDDPSMTHFTRAAAETWPKASWQLCHVSNGESAFRDRYHALHIHAMPTAFKHIPWLEVEARGKERAILALRQHWPNTATPDYGRRLDKITAAEKRAIEAADAE